jgi:hypothetical protein
MHSEAGKELVEEMTMYHAHVSLGDRFWLVHVPEVDRWTQARTLDEVDEMARDLVAVMERVDPETVELAVDIDLPAEVSDHWQRSKDLADQSKQLNSEAAKESRLAARALRRAGVTLRDIGRVLNVSYQRAGQLTSDA